MQYQQRLQASIFVATGQLNEFESSKQVWMDFKQDFMGVGLGLSSATFLSEWRGFC